MRELFSQRICSEIIILKEELFVLRQIEYVYTNVVRKEILSTLSVNISDTLGGSRALSSRDIILLYYTGSTQQQQQLNLVCKDIPYN